MKDTIELLAAIGSDANLRHASGEELADMLGTDASAALAAAAKSGDSSLLMAELGHKPMKVNHDVHTGGHGGDEPDHDHDHDHDRDDRDPAEPSRPDPDVPSKDR